jgi:signal transduction histidine kinase
MIRTIFHKMMIIFIAVLLVCFILTAILFNVALNRYVIGQRTEVLDVYGTRIVSVLEVLLENRFDPTSSIIFNSMLETVAINTSSLIWIVDDQGYILLYSAIPHQFTNKLRSNDGIYQLTDPKQFAVKNSSDPVHETGSFYGLFNDTGMQWLTVKIPFYFSDIKLNDRIFQGNVMMHTPVPEIKKTGTTILNLIIPAVFLSLFISIILVYFLSKRITNPLKEMTLAARRISSGEWQNKLSFSGNDEVAVLAESFNHMVETLENLEKMRRDFIANISHELRTPMTSINGFIEGILDGTIPVEKQKDYLNIVKDEVKRLQRLVSDLLDIARMEAGELKMNVSPFDICEVIRIGVIYLQNELEDKSLNFRANFEREAMFVLADKDAIQRVVINLLHNAVKFTPEGGNISVTVSEAKGKAEISVSDSGEGIPEEDLPYVFDRFHKADKSRGKDKTGVGLGLYIVKNIIKAHNEYITVRSKKGEGTTFTFHLTLDQS